MRNRLEPRHVAGATQIVDGTGDEFFSGAGFAKDQDCCVSAATS